MNDYALPLSKTEANLLRLALSRSIERDEALAAERPAAGDLFARQAEEARALMAKLEPMRW